jgi:hypothetical protein
MNLFFLQPMIEQTLPIIEFEDQIPRQKSAFDIYVPAIRTVLLSVTLAGCAAESSKKPMVTEEKMQSAPMETPAITPPKAILPVMPDDQPRTPPIPDEVGTPDEEKPII